MMRFCPLSRGLDSLRFRATIKSMDREDNKNIKNKYLLFLNIKMKNIKYNVNRLLLVLSFVLVLFGSYIGSSFGSTKKANDNDVVKMMSGASIFQSSCAVCHSMTAARSTGVSSGGVELGPNLDIKKPSLATIKAYVYAGAFGSGKYSGLMMPAFNLPGENSLDDLAYYVYQSTQSTPTTTTAATTTAAATTTTIIPTTTTQRATASPTGTTSPNQKATVTDINAEDTTVLDVIASPRYDINKKLNRIDLDVSAHADYANTKVAVQVYGRATSVTSPRWITLGRVILDESASALLKVRTSLNLKVCKDGAKIRLVDVDSLEIVSNGEIDYVSQNS